MRAICWRAGHGEGDNGIAPSKILISRIIRQASHLRNCAAYFLINVGDGLFYRPFACAKVRIWGKFGLAIRREVTSRQG
jgi:hypothetical protein